MDLREITEFFKDSLTYIIIFIATILFFTYIVSVQSVTGNSMNPNYNNGEFVLISKLPYKLTKVKRFDVVYVEDDEGKYYIKRVIGLPGDDIHYLNNRLYINSVPHEETFLNYVNTNNFMLSDICKECKNEIPEGEYLLLGDNREESLDSRTKSFGLRNSKDIKGKIIFTLNKRKDS